MESSDAGAQTTIESNDAGAQEITLMEEQDIVAQEQEHANKMFAEAADLWNQQEGWRNVHSSNGLVVESRPVGGSFTSSGLDVTRSTKVVEFDPQGLFNFLTSREGLRLMEPHVQDKGLFEPLMTLGFHPKGSIDIKLMHRSMEFPYIDRDLLVVSATDSTGMRTATKSIMHEILTGGSVYSDAYAGSWLLPMCRPSSSPTHERAVQTMALQIEREEESGNSLVRILYFSDLCGSYPRYKMKQDNIAYHRKFHEALGEALAQF